MSLRTVPAASGRDGAAFGRSGRQPRPAPPCTALLTAVVNSVVEAAPPGDIGGGAVGRLGDLLAHGAEQPGGELEDIGLVDDGELLTAGAGRLEGDAGDPLGGRPGDGSHHDGRVGRGLSAGTEYFVHMLGPMALTSLAIIAFAVLTGAITVT
ncbi:hypothetical protein M271_47435 [Streptomyces rapamycinicus NRRL 5491]|nr:hypothetical protein M271_47435 [Streptomyces rapamycinicus NRRL 5491]